MTWIFPAWCYVGMCPQICTFYHNCLGIAVQLFLGEGTRSTYKRDRWGSSPGCPPEPQFCVTTCLLGIGAQMPQGHPSARLAQCALLHSSLPSGSPRRPRSQRHCHLPLLCPEQPRVSKACWVFPCTISHTPPFLSIPIAPRPLLLQAWLIIIAS